MMEGLDTKRDWSPGGPVESFKPMLGNTAAGFILGGLLVAAGVVVLGMIARDLYQAGGRIPFHIDKGLGWTTAVPFAGLGVVMIGGGAWLVSYARWLLSHRVEFGSEGFRYHAGPGFEEVPWSQVAAACETILYERFPLKGPAKLLMPKIASRSYHLTTSVGKVYSFDGNSIKGIKRLGALLRERCEKNGVPWRVEEVHA